MHAQVTAGAASASTYCESQPGVFVFGNCNSGYYETTAVLQFFNTPSATNLQLDNVSFSTLSSDSTRRDVTTLKATIVEWSQQGSSLVAVNNVWSQTVSVAAGGASYSLDTSGVALKANGIYSLYLSDVSANDYVQLDTDPSCGFGGLYYYSYCSGGWSSVAGQSLAFSVAFDSLSPVPEPTLPGFALGVSGLVGFVAWKRRRKAAAVAEAA